MDHEFLYIERELVDTGNAIVCSTLFTKLKKQKADFRISIILSYQSEVSVHEKKAA